jgi:putative ABC transport system permease protein
MRFSGFIFQHLRHNWIRTLSTVLAMAVCIFLFATLQTLIRAATGNVSSPGASRLITRHNVSLAFQLPYSYEEQIAAVPGVKRVAASNWFGGVRDLKNPRFNFFPNFAVEAERFLDMYPEYQLPADQRQAFLGDRRGCVIGPQVAEKYKLRVGDALQLESNVSDYRIGKPFEFVVRGIYASDPVRFPSTNQNVMFFHYQYLEEATARRLGVGTFRVEIADQGQAPAISRAIDALFENSEAQTHTDTEAVFAASMMSLGGNLALLLNFIGLAVMFTILFVTGNTMSMAIRERRTEIGVLKTLGFPAGLVLRLVMAEAAAIGGLGGVLGLGLAQFATRMFVKLPMIGDLLRGVVHLGLPLSIAATGMGIALLLGLTAGFIPACLAYRAQIVDLLREA